VSAQLKPVTDAAWHTVCAIDDILPDMGVAALVSGCQVALFRIGETHEVHALDNHDPFSGANVMSRGIVGDIGGELVVASPVYKQHFSLSNGRCIEDAAVAVMVHPVRVLEGMVQVGL